VGEHARGDADDLAFRSCSAISARGVAVDRMAGGWHDDAFAT
jgi:hypothetical protein